MYNVSRQNYIDNNRNCVGSSINCAYVQARDIKLNNIHICSYKKNIINSKRITLLLDAVGYIKMKTCYKSNYFSLICYLLHGNSLYIQEHIH